MSLKSKQIIDYNFSSNYHFREELAIIENRILEKELLAKKKAEKRAKNIAVNKITLYLYI